MLLDDGRDVGHAAIAHLDGVPVEDFVETRAFREVFSY